MTTGREMQRYEAKRKGRTAAGAGALTVAAVVAAASMGAPLLAFGCAVVGGAWTGRKVYDWLRYRGEWGLRF